MLLPGVSGLLLPLAVTLEPHATTLLPMLPAGGGASSDRLAMPSTSADGLLGRPPTSAGEARSKLTLAPAWGSGTHRTSQRCGKSPRLLRQPPSSSMREPGTCGGVVTTTTSASAAAAHRPATFKTRSIGGLSRAQVTAPDPKELTASDP